VEVRDLLGHASVEMTERYAHLAPERLRGAVARLDGA
jgi:site-specific recombinase XerD